MTFSNISSISTSFFQERVKAILQLTWTSYMIYIFGRFRQLRRVGFCPSQPWPRRLASASASPPPWWRSMPPRRRRQPSMRRRRWQRQELWWRNWKLWPKQSSNSNLWRWEDQDWGNPQSIFQCEKTEFLGGLSGALFFGCLKVDGQQWATRGSPWLCWLEWPWATQIWE